MTTATASLPRGRVKLRTDRNERLAQGLLLAVCALLALFLLAPLAMILVKSTEDKSGAFVGLRLFYEYAQSPACVIPVALASFVIPPWVRAPTPMT